MTIEEALELAGERWPRGGAMMCPTGHDRKSPSLKLYTKDDSFFCFGCGRTGDAYGLLALLQDKPIGEILRKYSDQQFVTSEATQGMNVHRIREDLEARVVAATQPIYWAIRAAGLDLWVQDMLIDEATEHIESWLSELDNAPPREVEEAVRDRLAEEAEEWLASRGVRAQVAEAIRTQARRTDLRSGRRGN